MSGLKSTERPVAERGLRIEFDGKTYEGSYTVDGPVVAVSSVMLGTKCALRRGVPPDALAKIMLTEMVYEEQERNRQ